MKNLIEKFLYTGVGFIALTADKVQKVVNDLVDQSKISEDEGRKIVDDFLQETKSKRTELENKFKEITNNIGDNLPIDVFSKKDEEQALEERVEALEAQLGLHETAQKETANV